MKTFRILQLTLTFSLLFASACSTLRPQVPEPTDYFEPTVGGVWPEGQLLERVEPSVAHVDRGPAGLGSEAPMMDGPAMNGPAWVGPDQRAALERDQQRQRMNYSQNPNLPPSTKRFYEERPRVTRDDFIDSAPNEGSLWASNGETNYFFTKNRVRGLGDIVSIAIEDRLVKDIALEVKKSLNPMERAREIEIATDILRKGIKDPGGDKAKPAAGAQPAATKQAPAVAGTAKKPAEAEKKEDADKDESPKEEIFARFEDIDLTETVEVKTGETMLGEIVDRYPNGNYRIRATKRVPYRGTVRLVNLMGIAKGADINDTDSVPSGKLYEYRVAVFK